MYYWTDNFDKINCIANAIHSLAVRYSHPFSFHFKSIENVTPSLHLLVCFVLRSMPDREFSTQIVLVSLQAIFAFNFQSSIIFLSFGKNELFGNVDKICLGFGGFSDCRGSGILNSLLLSLRYLAMSS